MIYSIVMQTESIENILLYMHGTQRFHCRNTQLILVQSRKYIGEKSPGSLSPLLRLVGRHVHDACSVRPRRTLPL